VKITLGPYRVIGQNLIIQHIRLWVPRDYPKQEGVVIRAGVLRDESVARVAEWKQSEAPLKKDSSYFMTGRNSVGYPLQEGDILIADVDGGGVGGCIVEFQLTRAGSVRENAIEAGSLSIAGRDTTRPLFSVSERDDEPSSRLARQINESGVPDLSVPIYFPWSILEDGTPPDGSQDGDIIVVEDGEYVLKHIGLVWEGPQEEGEAYSAGEMVLDEGWLAVANEDTSDPAAPVAIGDPAYAYTGAIGSGSVGAKQIIMGQRYDPPGSAYVTGYRIWTVIGNRYQVYSVADPGTDEEITQLLDFVAIESGWLETTTAPILIPEGRSFDLIAIVSEPDPAPVTFTGDWAYLTNLGGAPGTQDPLSGEIAHDVRLPTPMKISKWDAALADRSAELLALVPGDIIDGAGVRWSIQSVVERDTHVEFGVAPLDIGPEGLQTFTFETVASNPITYGLDPGFWLNNENVRGLLAVDAPYDSIVPDDNQYGVDIRVQEAYASPSWDRLAYSEILRPPPASHENAVATLSSVGERSTLRVTEDAGFDIDAAAGLNTILWTRIDQTIGSPDVSINPPGTTLEVQRRGVYAMSCTLAFEAGTGVYEGDLRFVVNGTPLTYRGRAWIINKRGGATLTTLSVPLEVGDTVEVAVERITADGVVALDADASFFEIRRVSNL